MADLKQRILDLVDAGLGHSGGVARPMDPNRCPRQDCERPPVPGHEFCAPCLAWLQGDVDDDPTGKQPPSAPPPASVAPPPGVPADEWYAALDAAIASTS